MQIQMGKVSVFKMKLHYWQGIFVKLWTKLYTKLSVDHPPPKLLIGLKYCHVLRRCASLFDIARLHLMAQMDL